MKSNCFLLITLIAFVLLAEGCASSVDITTPAKQQSFKNYTVVDISPIQNEIVTKVDTDFVRLLTKKTIRNIVKLNRFERVGIPDEIVFIDTNETWSTVKTTSLAGDSASVAMLHIRLVKYDEGNFWVRFFLGFFGNGDVTLDISINDRRTGDTLVAGTTHMKVSGFTVKEVVDPLGDGIRNFVEDYFVNEKQIKGS